MPIEDGIIRFAEAHAPTMQSPLTKFGRLSRRTTLSTCLFVVALAGLPQGHSTQLIIATVNNAQMIQMQKLTPVFEHENPSIQVRWVTLKEHALREYVSADIATQSGQFDVVTIGTYDTPLWAKRGWLTPIHPNADYDVADLLPSIRRALSYHGRLYAAPFYGESSILMYRKDLLHEAGLTMPDNPTWNQIAAFAAKLNDPAHGIFGICLRGKPGWGENMALVSTMVNAFGGQWFDMRWRPQLQSRPWEKAVQLYVNLLRSYAPHGETSMGYNANLGLFEQGQCAMWLGASVAAGYVTDPALSKVAHRVGFAQAPMAVTAKGSHWLWAWALAIPSDIGKTSTVAAEKFINWATSRAYIQLVAARYGWVLAPPGTRKSTYANPNFRSVAPWAREVLLAIQTANPKNATLGKSPYMGIQYPIIPEFQDIGDQVGLYISQAVSGRLTVKQALTRGQYFTQRQMLLSGYPSARSQGPIVK